MSYLARHPESRLIFVFPKANEKLVKSGETIAKIQAKSFGQRVKVLYLEELVERILETTKDDPALQQHFEQFKEKYVLAQSS